MYVFCWVVELQNLKTASTHAIDTLCIGSSAHCSIVLVRAGGVPGSLLQRTKVPYVASIGAVTLVRRLQGARDHLFRRPFDYSYNMIELVVKACLLLSIYAWFDLLGIATF